MVCNESLALVAGPPSPAYPGSPVPATRVLVPLAPSLKTESKVALLKYIAPFESPVTAVGNPRLASRPSCAVMAPGPPAKVEMTYCCAVAAGIKSRNPNAALVSVVMMKAGKGILVSRPPSLRLEDLYFKFGGVATGVHTFARSLKHSVSSTHVAVVEDDIQAARRQLERMLENRLFARSEQLSRLLRFLVEQHLQGRAGELKESVIGVAVFGRNPDYNPKFDPIVRTEARRLRARLNEYYETEGKHDAIRIDLPKGRYAPVVEVGEGPQATSMPGEDGAPSFRKWPLIALAASVLTIVLVVLGLTGSNLRGLRLLKTRSAAYDLCIRARGFEAQPNVRGIETSINLFQQAIAKDPLYAPAYAGVAAGYAARSGFDGFDMAERAEMLARGWAAAEKAIQLDFRSADAHEAMAMMQARHAQWQLAERSFRHAIELAPHDVLWREHFVMFLLLPLGRVDEAIRELRAAE